MADWSARMQVSLSSINDSERHGWLKPCEARQARESVIKEALERLGRILVRIVVRKALEQAIPQMLSIDTAEFREQWEKVDPDAFKDDL